VKVLLVILHGYEIWSVAFEELIVWSKEGANDRNCMLRTFVICAVHVISQ
jgi:hypothetical protein